MKKLTEKQIIRDLKAEIETLKVERDRYFDHYFNLKKIIWGNVDHTRRSYIETLTEARLITYFVEVKPGKTDMQEQIKWLRSLVEKITVRPENLTPND